jgi:hypothetical protein
MSGRPGHNMTEQEIIDFIEHGPELAEERRYGLDLWALWANLRRSPEERLKRLEIVSEMIDQIRKANANP